MDSFSSSSVLSVKAKILISIFLMISIFVLWGILTLYRFQQTVVLHKENMDEFIHAVFQAQKMRDLLLEMTDITARRWLLGKSFKLSVYVTGSEEMMQVIELLKKTKLDTVEKEILSRIENNLHLYASIIKSQGPKIETLDRETWKQLILKTDPIAEQMQTDIATFIDINRSQMETNKKALTAFYDTSVKTAVVLLVFTLFLSGVVAWLLIASIIVPIKFLIQWLKEYKQSPEKEPRRIIPYRADELGFLTISFNELIQELFIQKENFRQQTVTDELTGLSNYRSFQQYIHKELANMERHNRKLALAIVDIDYFKYYNDANGHQMGNVVLKDVAAILKSQIREGDFVARFGGEEFVLVFSETDPKEALRLCERIRQTIERCEFPNEKNQPNGALTISIGLAFYPESAKIPKLLIEKADKALYQAKQEGRNRVMVDSNIYREITV